jgi:1-aminocyclopropane-1-carboxylate deaminase/D-cysteine desulfhydrase-like pyridoxal-dependent ACC family enzyme
MKECLLQAISHYPLAPFPRQSRVHPLCSFSLSFCKCYVKREDELGFGISGTKVRKYMSMLPALLKEKPDEAVLIGSAYSNHVLSFSQLLKENQVDPILFLLGDETCKFQGNLLYSALIAGKENIHWISRKNWQTVEQMAQDFAIKRQDAHKKTIVIPKGGNCAEALPGAMTLPLDILRNEKEMGVDFDHLFIDAGTGMTACALLLAFAFLQKPTFVHILLVAGEQEEFYRTLAQRQIDFEAMLGQSVSSPTRFRLYTPTNAAAFGSSNTTVFKTIAEIAQKEGFLTDPVFTAKLFYEGRKIITKENLKGNILFLHSGGGLGVSGFQNDLAKII